MASVRASTTGTTPPASHSTTSRSPPCSSRWTSSRRAWGPYSASTGPSPGNADLRNRPARGHLPRDPDRVDRGAADRRGPAPLGPASRSPLLLLRRRAPLHAARHGHGHGRSQSPLVSQAGVPDVPADALLR